jgi:hypothetical protein
VTSGVDQDGKSVVFRRYTTPVLANLAPGDEVQLFLYFQSDVKVQDDTKSFQGPGPLFSAIVCRITAT